MSVRHGCIVADWSRPFEDPITLPDGRRLATLEDAGNYPTIHQTSRIYELMTGPCGQMIDLSKEFIASSDLSFFPNPENGSRAN